MTPSNHNEASIRQLVGSLRLLVRALYLDSSKMSRVYGLTSAQSGVVRTIFKNGPVSSAELSRKLYVTPSNITGIIDRLVKKALVERIPQANDRRVVRIHLTEQGHALGEILPDPIEKKLIAGLAGLPPEHIRLLRDMIRQLLNAIDADAVTGAALDDADETVTPPEL